MVGLFSMSWVYFYFVNQFISTILDSIYKCYHIVFAFLSLTYFTQYDNLYQRGPSTLLKSVNPLETWILLQFYIPVASSEHS